MTRESKVEIEVRETITKHLAPNETLREFTWGTQESSMSATYFLFGAAFARRDLASFFIGLTDKRLVLVEIKGKIPTGEVYSISASDIKGFQYRRDISNGTLDIHLTADILRLVFDKRPWWPRANNMAKIMPLPK